MAHMRWGFLLYIKGFRQIKDKMGISYIYIKNNY